MHNFSVIYQGLKNYSGKSIQIIALHDLKAYYVVMPKVACSTVMSICADLLDFKLPENAWKPGVFRSKNYDSLIDKKTRDKAYSDMLSFRHLEDYWGFTFVRNPYDRLVSCYTQKIIQSQSKKSNTINGIASPLAKYRVFHRDMSFAEFAEAVCNIPDVLADPHFRSQSSFIYTKGGQCKVNSIGKFETLNEDLQATLAHLNKQADIPHLLKSKRSSWMDYYDENLKRMVFERYQKDFSLFGYSAN